jgi:hypothetical protein
MACRGRDALRFVHGRRSASPSRSNFGELTSRQLPEMPKIPRRIGRPTMGGGSIVARSQDDPPETMQFQSLVGRTPPNHKRARKHRRKCRKYRKPPRSGSARVAGVAGNRRIVVVANVAVWATQKCAGSRTKTSTDQSVTRSMGDMTLHRSRAPRMSRIRGLATASSTPCCPSSCPLSRGVRPTAGMKEGLLQSSPRKDASLGASAATWPAETAGTAETSKASKK